MLKMLKKEIKLSASPLSFIFLAFSLMVFIPGYPILMGVFFICFGIFQSVQRCRENNDLVYSALLPVAKRDVVRGKYAFALAIEGCGFVLMTVFTLVRMACMADAPVYRTNALMNANFVFLGFALLIFGLFNLIFLGGFFKTSYYFGKPFVTFLIAFFLTVGVGEALHHIPGLEAVNAFGFTEMPLQLAFLAGGVVLFILFTAISQAGAIRHFEKIDL
ncbi:MAG: ABC-2 transporter permease [Lachnospiraceae bacterium]|nr:ABC-2 transporter permease [Lachnospiraceae bacterium]